jgi:hypothetical protein
MSPEEGEMKSPAGSLQWLQDEVHNAKVQAGKLEQQVEQLQALLSDLVDQTRHHDEALGSINTQLSMLGQVQEDVRQLQTLTTRLREEQDAAAVTRGGHAATTGGKRTRPQRARGAGEAGGGPDRRVARARATGSIEETGRYQDSAATTAQQVSDRCATKTWRGPAATRRP